MLTLLWLKGLLTHRAGRLLGTSLGVALTVSLLASLGTFIASNTALMTQRAIASVPVDWQMQLSAGTDISTAQKALGQSTAYTALEQVNYASINGFTAQQATPSKRLAQVKLWESVRSIITPFLIRYACWLDHWMEY